MLLRVYSEHVLKRASRKSVSSWTYLLARPGLFMMSNDLCRLECTACWPQWETVQKGLIMVHRPDSCLSVCSFYLSHMKFIMPCTKSRVGTFNAFSFKLNGFLILWGISLFLLLIKSRGITGGRWGLWEMALSCWHCPGSWPDPARAGLALPNPALPRSDLTLLPEESAAIDYWAGLRQRTKTAPLGSFCVNLKDSADVTWGNISRYGAFEKFRIVKVYLDKNNGLNYSVQPHSLR